MDRAISTPDKSKTIFETQCSIFCTDQTEPSTQKHQRIWIKDYNEKITSEGNGTISLPYTIIQGIIMDTLSRESSSESLVLPAITAQSLCTSHYGGTVQDQLRKASCPALLPALTITQDPDQPAYGTGIYYSPDQPCCEGGVYYTPSSSQRPSWSLQLPTLPSRSPRGSLSSRGRRSSSIIALGYALFDITPVSWATWKIQHVYFEGPGTVCHDICPDQHSYAIGCIKNQRWSYKRTLERNSILILNSGWDFNIGLAHESCISPCYVATTRGI